MDRRSKVWTTVAGGALVLAGFGAGAAVAVMGSASASDGAADAVSGTGERPDPTKSFHPGERLLTGETARKVRAAALGKYPGATVQRVETDAEGVYEAHVVTAGGEHVTVQVGKDFTVTGTQASRGFGGGHGRGRGHDGHFGDHRGPGPDADGSPT
jgi:hypothetical protein